MANSDFSKDLLWRGGLTTVVLVASSIALFWTFGGMAIVQPDSTGWPQLNEDARQQLQGQLQNLPWPDWEQQGERLQGLTINRADSTALKVYYFLDPTCPGCIQQDRKAMAQLLEGPVERSEVQLLVLPVFQKGVSRDALTLYRRLVCTARREQEQYIKRAWEELFFGSRDGFWATTTTCEEEVADINQLIRWQSQVGEVLQLQAGAWMLEQGQLPGNWEQARKLIEAAIQQQQNTAGAQQGGQ